MLMLLNYCGKILIQRVVALRKGRVLVWHVLKSPLQALLPLDSTVISGSSHSLMNTGNKINRALFDECLLGIFDWKEEKKNPSFHFLINYLKNCREWDGWTWAFLLQNWANIVFGILVFLSHNEFSHWMKKEHSNFIDLFSMWFLYSPKSEFIFWYPNLIFLN